MSDWTQPSRPAERAERQLIGGIQEGQLPMGSSLPAERELAARLGVTRPTLRETLWRLDHRQTGQTHPGPGCDGDLCRRPAGD
jgi:GntR family negative regulator for fad regulon and positive regulator of fabA